MFIPFNHPYVTGRESEYIRQTMEKRKFSGNGEFSQKCARWLEEQTGCKKAILVPSGTAALEMMMLLARIGPGDEVIMPSFTFSSTANAVVLRGATPVFVDIRPDTLNMDESLIEAAITSRSKAILPVHYAGVGCEMDVIMTIAKQHNLLVLEDAAQCILSYYNDQHLGTFGQMSAISFHETKNIHCGEGGALLINDPSYVERAEIIMEKGTDRSKFFRGEVDKYTWVDIGSSFLMNEMTAAFLWAQLEAAKDIISKRLGIWNQYHESLALLEERGFLRRPFIPEKCRQHNGHIYYVLLNFPESRDSVMADLKEKGIYAVFHYIPLDTALAMHALGHSAEQLKETADLSARLLRLPLFVGLQVEGFIESLRETIEHLGRKA